MENINELSIDELKKRIQKEEAFQKSKKPLFTNPIDKLTSVDELLRLLIKEQRITNNLLLGYIKRGADGSIASIPNGIDTSAILEGLKRGDDYKTIVSNIGNIKITGSSKIFELEGSGWVAECRFQSSNSTVNNKAYGVKIITDKSMGYQDTFANFFNRSFHETDMSCWEDVPHGYYLLVFQKIAFAKSLIIEVYGSIASFSDIYLKYHLKVVS